MLALVTIVLIFYIFILRKKVKRNREEYIYLREPPTNDTPSYVGKVIKGHTDGNDIISTILDLNMKGFINIFSEEIKRKRK